MKKIGLICLTLVFALGAMGVGYAMWTDTIDIDGTVNTGTVNIVVENYSGQWMWKIPGGDPDYELSTDKTYTPTSTITPTPFVVAYSEARQAMSGDPTPTPIEDAVTVEFDNIFPVEGAWEADFEAHYIGSIPVKVVVSNIDIELEGDPENTLDIDVQAYVDYNDGQPGPWEGPYENVDGIQLHNSDRIRFVIIITVPQHELEEDNEVNMGLTGTVTGTIQVVQWNEYTPAP